MKQNYGNIGTYKPTSFYDRKEGKKPVLLFILPVLMVLVIIGALYMAYRDSLSASTASSVPSVSSMAVRIFAQNL